uniref:Solute carrier family 35 member F5 n=2 Tax=Lygus hesperus TaxID=30085 RepID=A0A146LTQ2_LYGHE
MINKSRRLLVGLFVLLLVDVIWVSSSELTKYLYQQASFEKPFFSTYVKTSMFTIYLLGLCFYPPWKDYCSTPSKYMHLETDVEDDHIQSEESSGALSPPTYVPIKWEEKQEKCSGSESDDSSLHRAVKFCKLAEVRQMSASHASDAFWARLSYHASIKASHIARRAANKLSVDQVAKIAFYFCLLWFVANYTFQAALAYTDAGTVALLSSSSSVFTLLLAALFPAGAADRFTFSKLLAVIFSIVGLIVISVSHSTLEMSIPLGFLLPLLSAFLYASYLVFLRRIVENDEKLEIPMFFGFVGLFNLLLLWPVFFLLHYCRWESFEWPNKHQWTFIIINGLVGTVLSEALWLWGCLLTSSLIATLALSLTIPLSIVADMVLSSVEYSALFFIGSVPVFFSLIFVMFLNHHENADPVCTFLRRLSHRESRISEAELEQRESLISINEDHEA